MIQWHITDRCNLRCRHCYQTDAPAPAPTFDDLCRTLDQITVFLNAPRADGAAPVRGHVTLTGGEPFIREDFLRLLALMPLHRQRFSFAILTNGTLINQKTARYLRDAGPAFVQVSLEGTPKTHDRIRGNGSFEQTVRGVKALKKAGVRTIIAFTAHQDNFMEFAEVARIARKLKADRVWADRLVPFGRGAAYADKVLTPEHTRRFFRVMKQARNDLARSWRGRTEVAMHRALQFLSAGTPSYHCTAGETLLTIMPDDTVLPCRRMPIPAGNLKTETLSDIYRTSDILVRLRRQETFDPACAPCHHVRQCRGGLKCLSYALTGDPFRADPGCWLAA